MKIKKKSELQAWALPNKILSTSTMCLHCYDKVLKVELISYFLQAGLIARVFLNMFYK